MNYGMMGKTVLDQQLKGKALIVNYGMMGKTVLARPATER
jgi:hypothetical protein